MQPIIGIACPAEFLTASSLDPSFTLSTRYADGIMRCGGTPLLIPLRHHDYAPIRQMAQAVDGIILAGGGDPAPHLFGEEPLQGLGEVDYERDLAEMRLIEAARELNKPLLGICRGMQIINVALGGTLIQDIPSQVAGAGQHSQKGSLPYGSHHVRLEPGFLRDALQTDSVLVNSFHHQAVKDPAPGLRVTAVAPDGIIEAFESDDQMVIGIQWHPECMWKYDDGMLRVAERFVEKVSSCKR
ncbi:gamma-glutamyl-gamma-aminobutyrate hydrolase family protein [Brevibacillus fluminis]|uniref:Gamma-glutamyl-gamma-aminobutyrate hydrolase family protein n=1 Tax=Brevibacillus fluminis TaxID=511487 RepID=A0A3M8DIU2_9BACL|nr:gamma-glutamyl-gamma-aminobutyrate hydrolase family protein [Brevibacillus fluminis]RNB87047.1 gamma-glutamyl-gamma-aminobutyrate hydrolase family protein [Brevibacillus fluminis]